MKHTPGEIAFTTDRVLMSEDGKPLLCHDHSPNRPAEESAANRAHLCLCWNTHDELIKALTSIRFRLDQCRDSLPPYIGQCIAIADAAVEKGRGK